MDELINLDNCNITINDYKQLPDECSHHWLYVLPLVITYELHSKI